MPLVAPVILPEMYKIFTMAEVGSTASRPPLPHSRRRLGSGQPPPLVGDSCVCCQSPSLKARADRDLDGVTRSPFPCICGDCP